MWEPVRPTMSARLNVTLPDWFKEQIEQEWEAEQERSGIRPLQRGSLPMGSPNNNDFSWALVQLRDGKCVTREKWSYPGKHVGLVKQENIIPNPVDVQMDQPFFYLSGKQRQLAPWTPSHEDLLATDWEFA